MSLEPFFKPPSEQAVAYHEAGHVVVAVALLLEIEEASIEADPARWSNGHVQVLVPLSPSRDLAPGDWQERKAITALAGGCAEHRLQGFTFAPGLDSDFALARDALRRSGKSKSDDPSGERHIDAMQKIAQTVLDENWKAVQAVADELLERKTMLASDATAIANRNIVKFY